MAYPGNHGGRDWLRLPRVGNLGNVNIAIWCNVQQEARDVSAMAAGIVWLCLFFSLGSIKPGPSAADPLTTSLNSWVPYVKTGVENRHLDSRVIVYVVHFYRIIVQSHLSFHEVVGQLAPAAYMISF